MTCEGSTSSVAAEDVVRSSKASASVTVVKVGITDHFSLSALNVASLIMLAAFTTSNTAVILYMELH